MDPASSCLNAERRNQEQWLERLMKQQSTATTSQQAALCCDELRILACDFEGDHVKLKPSVEKCIKLMDSHASEVKVQKSATLALMVLCEKHKMAEFMGQEGVVPLVVSALNVFSKDQALVKNAILLTRSLLLVEVNRSIFCEHRGFKALSSAMIAFPDRESIQCSAAALIATICYENEGRRLLAFASGVLPLLVDALNRYEGPIHWKVQSNVCMALRNLSRESVICKEILSQGGVLRTIGNIIKPNSNPLAIEEALGVCLNIVTAPISECSEMLENASHILVGFVMEFLSSTVKSFRRNGKCHEMGFALLRACEPLERGPSEENRRTERMRIAVLYAAAYASNRSSSSVSIVSSSCLLIRTMLIDSTNRRLFSEVGRSVATLVRSIAFLTHSPVHVEHSLLALGNAVFDSPAGKLKACEWGALRFIANAMKINHTNAAVAEAGLITIHGLCIDNEKVGNLASSFKFHDLCTETMAAFEASPTIQERGLAALLSMGYGRQAKKQLHASNAMQAAERAADLYPYSKNILALRAKLESLEGDESEHPVHLPAAVCDSKPGCETHESKGRLQESDKHRTQAKRATLESFSTRILCKLPSLQNLRSKSE
ncbi:Armadillo-like helical domain containing protein [Gracilaria domingensis]|nr:Armadillo-like helical domain containing protein [Gracilaria domingensis]